MCLNLSVSHASSKHFLIHSSIAFAIEDVILCFSINLKNPSLLHLMSSLLPSKALRILDASSLFKVNKLDITLPHCVTCTI